MQTHTLRMTGLRVVSGGSRQTGLSSVKTDPLCLLPTEHVVVVMDAETDQHLLERWAQLYNYVRMWILQG